VKILHTADLHLTEKAPERWAALEQIVALARTHSVSALLIAGDLFDHNVEADKLRPRLRSVLAGSGFQTIVLPGNHDHKAYRSGLYFGDNVTVINSWSEPVRLGDLIIWGLPYEKISGEDLVGRLRSMGALMNPKEFNILLYHGELFDAYFSRQELGDEGDQRYMPARLSYFEQMPLQYVLAGHFHSRYSGWQLPGGGLFIYPGSPVSVTRREIGRRVVNLLDHCGVPVEIPLDSYHYETITLDLDPFSTADPLLLLEQRLQDIHSEAKVILTVRGLFNGSALGMHESELASSLREKVQDRLAGEPVENFYDVQHVLEDDLFRQFKTRLAEKGSSPEQMEQVTEMVIRAFRVVKACS
jgi:DNA repair protein SbcD/Mre11